MKMTVEVPCEIGDEIYQIGDVWYLDNKEAWKFHYEKEIIVGTVTHIHWSKNKNKQINMSFGANFRYNNSETVKAFVGNHTMSYNDLGVTWFLTENEAKEKLKELIGDK